MDAVESPHSIPARLLLATDLSARCDRALDRAAQLAREWEADLIALNVLDPGAAADQALAQMRGEGDEEALRIARKQLARDLSRTGVRAAMRITRADDAAAAIRGAAQEADCGLVVTGVARNETLGRFLLGSTVERLARSLPQPLLVVRNRPHGPYRRIVVATDFSEPSHHALQVAARLFPPRALVLYHARQAPFGSRPDGVRPGNGAGAAGRECSDFATASGLGAEVALRPVLEYGALETALTRYVRAHRIELVVMGTHGRSGVMSILLGSSAARLLDWLPCDALVVRAPGAGT